MSTVSPRTAAREGRRLAEDARRTLETIEQALKLPGDQVTDRLQDAERAVARVRDDLIERLRQGSGQPEANAARDALDRVNVCLSLIVGVAYPQTGVKRPPLQQAGDILEDLQANRLPALEG